MKRIMTAEFFAGNRARVMENLQGGVLVMTAYTSMQRANDAAFRFSQEANFWYLTGIDRPDWWLIIDASRGKSWLVRPDIDPVRQLFDGGLSSDDARTRSGIDAIITRAEADDLLAQTARQHRLVYTVDQPDHVRQAGFVLNPALGAMRDKLARLFQEVRDYGLEMARLRAIKQPLEIKAIEAAIKITAEALSIVHERMSSYHYEYEIEADLTREFVARGASGHAYDPIVAAGAHACTLHYADNNARLKKRSLVLIDVGAEVEHYAADLTRTYAYGTPTARQREIHEALAAAHRDIIDLLKPGLSVAEYGERVDARMRTMLDTIGLPAPDDRTYRIYFPHAISHGLGLDVHDSLGKTNVIKPGMVVTVEPGVYLPDEQIGARIEDDILITERSHRNLSRRLATDL